MNPPSLPPAGARMPADAGPRPLLRALFDAAVAAAMPDARIRAYLPAKPRGRTVVVGAGKGAAQMARAFEKPPGTAPLEGLVVTRYGYAVPCARIEIIEAAHPGARCSRARRPRAALLDTVAGLDPGRSRAWR